MNFEQLKEKLKNGQFGPDLEALLRKIGEPCDLKAPLISPQWLDEKLFETGTQFFWDYYFSIVMSSFQSLLIGLSIQNLW